MIDTKESLTAKLCSFARAHHSYHGRDKIFDDYLAYDIMGKEEYEEIGQLIENDFEMISSPYKDGFIGKEVYPKLDYYISPIPLSRIAFSEREFMRFAEENGECQYVICGAGMDTFSFRNDNPDIKIFEIDHPDTQRYKKQRISELEWIIPSNVNYVPVDFNKDDMTEALIESGFDINKPAFFSILGVTYYLTLPVFEQTIEKISSISKTGNKIVFDFPNETTFTDKTAPRVRELSDITAKLGEPMQHGFSVEEIDSALRRHGFKIDKHETPEKIQKEFFKNREDGQRAFENIHFILSEKEKQ